MYSCRNNEIHIAFGIQDNTGDYIYYLATTIISIFEHTSEHICIHILHDDSIKNDKKIFLTNIIKKYNNKIKFYLISTDIIKTFNITNYSLGAYFRLYIFKYCKVEKIIYLDSDILVNKDISTFWNINIDNYCCAAIKDLMEERKKINNSYYKLMGIKYENYFNSGVMLLNISNINKKFNVIEEAKSFFEVFKYTPLPDQDFFNYLLKENTLIVNKKFNFIVKDDVNFTEVINSKYIIHFAGRIKPWCSKNPEIIYTYYKYMYKCLNENQDEFIIKKMSMIPLKNFEKLILRDHVKTLSRKRLCKLLMLIFINIIFKNNKPIDYINKIKRKIRCLYMYLLTKQKIRG
ncbi:glycosyltransferase family 8 protein [Megamonas funiformis]|uniref:glycosyltransferase family 8 protein n=1 Tax=Megamonas funiformis TaxID=437897 RepID=UPI0022DFE1FB|nr:glycosyltransferase family 8 protein [Megamonas funiformis]